ncbi:MAG: hypothetical protein JWR01_518, partial [Subtercola sp.]|nr:hypothetical protein [Subtercola sp.]
LAIDGVVVENIATTAKTLPGFAALWEALVFGEPGQRAVTSLDVAGVAVTSLDVATEPPR